ncbi:UDP-N-acetylglucosamine 4,6-dehydratase (inverting) [Pseudomonadota bacterium]
MNLLNYKSLLVTGGTGSFGRAFVRHVLDKYPAIERVVIYSRDEFKQFEMKQSSPFDDARIRYFVGDVRDKDRLYRAFEGVDVVIHAAALKQIPSCEYNPFEAVKTNIHGAQNVIDAAIDRNVNKVVALSTDKACAPINLYGATKLCSDKLFIAGNSYTGNRDTVFCVVRYGNVVGSRGSVIPYFMELLKNGEKRLPITDKKMTRFWLTMDRAVDLVKTALEYMGGGELFVCKIPSVKIVDVAEAVSPGVKLKVVGIRPGEKMHEMMITRDDARHTLEFNEYYVIQPRFQMWGMKKGQRRAAPVKDDFEYNSQINSEWLSVRQIRRQLKKLEII